MEIAQHWGICARTVVLAQCLRRFPSPVPFETHQCISAPAFGFLLAGCAAPLPCPSAPTSPLAPTKSVCWLVTLPAGLGDEGGRAAQGCVPRPRCLGDAWLCREESCKKLQNPNHRCSWQHCPAPPEHPQLGEGCCPAPTYPPVQLARYCLARYYHVGMQGKRSTWGRAGH